MNFDNKFTKLGCQNNYIDLIIHVYVRVYVFSYIKN